MCGEELKTDSENAETFVDGFKALVEEIQVNQKTLVEGYYSLNHLFNADETGLCYKLLPKVTLSSANDDPVGTKTKTKRTSHNQCLC